MVGSEYFWAAAEGQLWLFLFAIVILIYGSIHDLRFRLVPDWISYGCAIIALGARVMISIGEMSYMPLAEGLVGALAGFAVGCFMFYTGQWGGGDSKILIALGALMGLWWTDDWIVNPPFFILFLISMLIVGAIYGIGWMKVLMYRHFKDFTKSFSEHMAEPNVKLFRYVVLISSAVGLIATLFLPSQIRSSWLILVALWFLLFYIYVAIKAVEESCMKTKVKPTELYEGDWLTHDIKVGSKVVVKKDSLGLTEDNIGTLIKYQKQGKVKKVEVKLGVPFVPSFFLTYIILFFLGNWPLVLFSIT